VRARARGGLLALSTRRDLGIARVVSPAITNKIKSRNDLLVSRPEILFSVSDARARGAIR